MRTTTLLALVLAVLLAACAAPVEPVQPAATIELPTMTPAPLATPTQATEPADTPPAESEPPSGAPAPLSDEEVVKALSDKLGVDPDQMTIVSMEPVDWPNSCLGVDTMEVMCAEVITPGYRIVVEIDGQPVEVHTNADLSVALTTEPLDLPSTAPASYDPADIYAAAIRQVYTVDHTFGQPPNFPVVYLVRKTDDSVGASGSPANGQTIAPADQERLSTALADLPAEMIWVDSAEEAPRDANDAVADGGAIITVGNITPQDDGTLHVPASIYIGMLAAGGQTYVLENTTNGWQITGTTGPAWIS